MMTGTGEACPAFVQKRRACGACPDGMDLVAIGRLETGGSGGMSCASSDQLQFRNKNYTSRYNLEKLGS